MSEYETEWVQVSLENIMKWYSKDFEPTDGDVIVDSEWFLDLKKETVVFKLTTKKIEPTPDTLPSKSEH